MNISSLEWDTILSNTVHAKSVQAHKCLSSVLFLASIYKASSPPVSTVCPERSIKTLSVAGCSPNPPGLPSVPSAALPGAPNPIYLAILLVYCSWELYIFIAAKSRATNNTAPVWPWRRRRKNTAARRLHRAPLLVVLAPETAHRAAIAATTWMPLFRLPGASVSKQNQTDSLRIM